jgi:hypothetical protein
MESSGRNWSQPVANGTAAKTAQTGENRCREFQPYALSFRYWQRHAHRSAGRLVARARHIDRLNVRRRANSVAAGSKAACAQRVMACPLSHPGRIQESGSIPRSAAKSAHVRIRCGGGTGGSAQYMMVVLRVC